MLYNQALDIPQTLQNAELQGLPIHIALMSERCRYSLRMKSSDISAFQTASELKLPSRIGKCHISGKSHISDTLMICCLGPDEWFISASAKAKNRLETLFTELAKTYAMSVTDVSHRNIGLTLSGLGAQTWLCIGCPQDLSLATFPVGQAARTVFENAPILLIRTGKTEFTLECWRSYGPYLRDFLTRTLKSKIIAG